MPDKHAAIRVCFVADYSGLIGGKERQLLEILKFLQQEKVEFQVISLSSEGLLYTKLAELFPDRVLVIDRMKSHFIRTVSALREFIRSHPEDKVYHAMDSLSILFLLIASCFFRKRIINGAIRHAGVEKSWAYLIDVLLLQMSSVIIANSFAGLKYYHVRKGYVLYNAIDPTRFERTKGSPASIVMVANFSDYKDHKTFFTATAGLIREGRIISVGLVGDGKHQRQWKEFVRNEQLEPYYRFYGHNSRVEQILTEYGTGVLCSTKQYREGISNSILEYMSTGLLVVASDIGATCEIIQSGYNGLLFEAENPADLKDKLTFALDNPESRHNMTSNAYVTLHEKFNYTANLNKLLNIYRESAE